MTPDTSNNSDKPPLILDGSHIGCRLVPFSSAEKKHLKTLVPFMLEPELASPVEELHFVFANPSDDHVLVAYCNREWLSQQLENYQQQHQCEPKQAYADYSLLPTSNDISLAQSAQSIFCRHPQGTGFSLEPDLAQAALLNIGVDQTTTIFSDNKEQLERLVRLLPETARDKVNVVNTAPTLDSPHSINFCQGEFSPRSEVKHQWQQWRLIPLLGACALLLYLSVLLLQLYQLDHKNTLLKQQISQTVNSALGKKVRGNSQQQLNLLRSTLKQQSLGSDKTQVLPLLLKALRPIKSSGISQIDEINIDASKPSIRLSLRMSNFTQLNQVQSLLQKQQFDVQVLSSNQSEKVHSASLLLKPKQP